MPNQEKSQDFELIELLIREVVASTSTQQGSDFESFKARFQSYIDQIPSYLHSVGKEGFFPHFFLGSFSTFVDTEIAKKLDIKKIYFKFDDSKTLKVAVIRKGDITNQKSAIEKVNLFVISESDSESKKFTYGELEEILGQSNLPAQNQHIRSARDDLRVKLVKVVKTTGEISVGVKDDKLDKNASATHEFKEIKKGLWSNPENDIEKLTNSNAGKVKESVEEVLKKVGKIHSKYKDSLVYANQAREAAHHGFVAGALVNFRYRHNLRVYLEQFAGRGYADIVLVPRGKDRSLNAVPIIIELKAGTATGTTPGSALEQAKDYAKGFQPNTMRVLTVSDNVLCVGLNLDLTEGEKSSIYISPPADRKPAPPTVQKLLEVTSSWNGEKSTITNVKEKIKQPLERIYHTFPGTPEKGGNYFSRFLLGQLLLADKFIDIDLEKSVFLYNEYPLASSTRLGAQSTARPVTTFMLTKGNYGQDKEVFIFHIREGGKGEFSKKKMPINLPKVGKITEVCISLQEERKSDFFAIERVDRSNSIGEYKEGKESFNGEWKNIPYPAGLKETFDAVLESQLASSQDQSQSIGKYKELFGKLGEAVLPFKGLIEKEAHTQAVFHGAFSHYSDIKLVESQENRALVLTEFQTGRGKRIDMLVHGIKFANQASSAKEYDPVGLELKGPREGKTANALKDEANKQISDEYTKGVTYKTLTDGKEVDFVGVVFDKGASNADSLILMSKDEFSSVKVVHSSIFSFSQQQPKNKFDPNLCVKQSSRSKRSVNPCLFSKGDVEKFSKGKVDENNVDKIIIDSEKFLTYVKNSRDEAKNAQLVEFVGDKSIEGDRKYLLDKVVADQGYERYVQNERIKDLHGDISQKTSSATKSSKLKGRLMNAAGGIQLIRGIHGAIVSCKDGTATDCGLNLGGIGWSFASQPIENVMVKITPKVVASAEKIVGKIPGVLGKQTKFAVRVAGVKFGSAIARGTAGALTGVFDIIDIGISANNLIDCKNRESSDNPCGEKEIRDNVASISFSGVSFVSGVALTAAGMPVVGIAVGFGLMVGYGIYSGVSDIVEYKKKYDTTHGENWSIFWRTILSQDMASDVQHLADRKNTVDSLAKGVWQALNNGPNSVVAYGIGLGKVSGNTLRPNYATIMMNRTDANAKNLSRVIPSHIKGASRICLPQITNQDYEKGIKSSVKLAVYYCENAMVISHNNRVKMKQEDKTIVYDLQNVNGGTIVGSNVWNNNFLIYSGTAEITGGSNKVVNRFVVNNVDFSGKIIGGSNSVNILDLSQLKDTVIGVNVNYRFKPSSSGSLRARVNGRWLINDQIDNNGIFNYYYVGRKNKVDEVLCMGYSEHFTGTDDRDVIIDSGGSSNNNEKDIVENCKKVIISPYTTVKGGKSNYTFYVKAADYKGKGLYSEIDVDGTGTIVFPEFDLLSDCDQITYSTESNTLSLKINFGQNNQFTLDIKNYVNQSSNKPHFVLIDKNGSNIVPKIERSDSPTMEIKSFELHSEHSLDNFDDVENHYKKILNNDKSYKVLSVIRGKVQNQSDSVVPHMVFGSLGDDIINFDQGTVFARGGKGNDVYVVGDSIGNKEVKIDNNSDDEKLDMLLMPVVKRDFSIQQCDLHLNYNNTSIQVKNYLQGHNYRHLIVMNDKGEAFIPNIQSMSCSPSSSEKGKLVPFLQATQTQNMFLLSKDFQDDHIVIDSHLEDIEKYKDKDDLLLIRESEIPFIIRMEGFYNDRSKWENISYSLWNNNDLFPSSGLLENVDDVMDYKDKLRTDYERIVKEYVIDFSNSTGTIKHNQKLERDISTFVGQDEERIGVVILKNITPDRVEISSNGADLIFCDKRSNHTVNIKSWNNVKSYRISTLEFDLDLESIIIRKLDRFNLSEVRKIQDLIEKASENYKNKGKYTPKIENDFKCLVSIDSFESENKNSTYQCLGFSSLQDQISFTENFCSLEQLTEFRDKSNSTQISALSRKLQNNLSLNGYDQNVIDQCSELMITRDESNGTRISESSSKLQSTLLLNGYNQSIVGQYWVSKISAIVKNMQEFASLSQSENKLDLGGCLSERRKRSSDFCPVFLEGIHNELNREESERKNIVVGENSTRVITSDHEILDIENLPIREVVINDNINRKRSLRSTLDLRKLVQQINKDLGMKPISTVIKDASDLLIKLSISATGLQQDVITVRLEDAFINKWYKKLQIIFDNAPMEIDNSLYLKPSLLISDKRIIVVTPQEVEEKNKLFISKKAGQYSYLHDKYDLIVTNAFNANIMTNNLDSSIEVGELFIIYFKDFYKEPKMKTFSIRFIDKEIPLSDEIDKIYNADSIDKLNYVSSILDLQESSLPLEVSSSSDIKAQGKFKRTPLHFASEAGEWDRVRLLLDRGANIEVQDEFGYTPIFLATQSGKWSVVELLLNYGANVDAQDKEGQTLLCFAVSGNNLDMVQFLLDRGARIEVQDKSGYTPILYAAQSGKWGVVKLFIDNGAKFNNETTFQGTPLHFAVQEGNFDMVQFLLDKNANIEVRGNGDKTPLHLAIEIGNLNVVRLLLNRGANIEAKCGSITPLQLAAQEGKLDIFKLLLDKHASIKAKGIHVKTILHFAAQGGNTDIIKLLLDMRGKSTGVNVKDQAQRTPLYFAAQSGNLDAVNLLLDRGASTNKNIVSGETLLHAAAKSNKPEIIKVFLDRGIGIESKDIYGRTPVLLAAQLGELDAVRFFIIKGAKFNNETTYEGTPLHFAVQEGNLGMVRFLLDKGASVEAQDAYNRKPLHIAVDANRLNVVNLLLDRGANLKATDMYGKTPLDLAIQKGYEDIVEVLKRKQLDLDKELLISAEEGDLEKIRDSIRQGANVNVQGRQGWTPVFWAIQKNNFNIVELLLDNSADIKVKDNEGWTPLHWAVQLDLLNMVKYLAEKGADIDALTADGRTPLDIVREKFRVNGKNEECSDVVQCLEKLNQEREKPVQRRRRHHHGDHNRHQNHLSRKPLAIDQPKIAVSSTTRPSSWINDLFSWVKSSVGGLFYSRAALPEETLNTASSTSQINAPIDVNGTIMLLDLLIRRVTGQKYISSLENSISLLEAQGYAWGITKRFEKVLNETAIKSGISVTNLNLDPLAVQSAIVGKIRNGKFSEISKTLYSFAKGACPEFKQTDKFLDRLRSNLKEEKETALLQQKVEKPYKILDQQVSGKVESSKKPDTFLNGTSVVKGISRAINR
ncbi:ankyrin repeat domain-containing protein [Wolbachia endosymbiont (group A) of Acrocera orbiculus]|uniref:ankyrin repeat domain-containing protein n=1 Tax=Wolbachia endosymbiont (group A) of Acrocera orbiculus TaxID=2953971 RepID=UPI002225D2B5|nr:ankyrin repeat domain-containing protein [Wolbachia endosymbiont (group A) of Acrocera orbiculus]